MSIKRLQLIDIHNAEEEALIQTVINSKVASEPVKRQVNIRVPDIRNGEDEAIWQAKIDAAREELRPDQVKMGDIVPDGEVEIKDNTEVISHTITPIVEAKKSGKECCGSLGLRHKKNCPTLNK